MRAMLCTAFEGAEGLELGEAPEPALAPDEVMIEVRASPVSFMDVLMTQGGYQMRPDLPYVPGTDAAGVVTAVGAEVDRFRPGDRVATGGWHGGWAERMAAKHWKCARIPDGLDFAPASMVIHNHLTALHALRDRAALRPGETLFVTGAVGGVGLAVMDMARALGARVIAGVGDPAKAEAARAAGAEAVVIYGEEDLKTRLRELTGGRGVDVAVDMIGGETFLTLGRVMAWGGRLIPLGFVSGEIPALPMNLPLLKGYSVVGVFMGAWLENHPEEAVAACEELMAWTEQGRLTPQAERVLSLDEAAEAMRLLEARAVRGRIVLEI